PLAVAGEDHLQADLGGPQIGLALLHHPAGQVVRFLVREGVFDGHEGCSWTGGRDSTQPAPKLLLVACTPIFLRTRLTVTSDRPAASQASLNNSTCIGPLCRSSRTTCIAVPNIMLSSPGQCLVSALSAFGRTIDFSRRRSRRS